MKLTVPSSGSTSHTRSDSHASPPLSSATHGIVGKMVADHIEDVLFGGVIYVGHRIGVTLVPGIERGPNAWRTTLAPALAAFRATQTSFWYMTLRR